MKKFKAIGAIVITIMMMPFMQSCLDSYNDELDGMNNDLPYNAALATIIIPSEVPGEAVIESDNEGTAYVVNPDILTINEVNKEGQRIFYSYTNAENPKANSESKGPFINITKLQKVLTKSIDILKEGEEDVYGYDAITLISYNLGKTHLTLIFQILGYDSKIKHRISLVATAGAKPDAEGYLSVELRHNAEGDRQVNPGSGYVSFPLSNIPGYKEGTLKGFRMKVNFINNGEDIVTISKENSKAKNFQYAWEEMYNTKIK